MDSTGSWPENECEPVADLLEERGAEFPPAEVYSREEEETGLLIGVLDPDAEPRPRSRSRRTTTVRGR